MKALLVFAAAVFALAACGGADTGSTTTIDATSSTSAADRTTTTLPAPTTAETTMPAQAEAVEAAKSDLAALLQVDPSLIVVARAESVEWPDGSLGCPQDDEMYTQALVSGTQILLDVDGRVYDYRADDVGNVKLCPSDDEDGGYDFVPSPGIDS